jgi:hypothetical protein
VLLSSGDSFPHLIQKPSSQLGFVTYLLNYLRTYSYCIDQMQLARYLHTCIYVKLMSLYKQVNLKVTRMTVKPSTCYRAIIYTAI